MRRFFLAVAVGMRTMGIARTMSIAMCVAVGTMIRTMGFMQNFHVFELMTLTGHDAEGCERQQ